MILKVKEWYTPKEISQLIDRSVKLIRKDIETGAISDSLVRIEFIKNFKFYLIHVSYVEQQLTFQASLSNDYYKRAEVMNMLNKSNASMQTLINKGIFKDIVFVGSYQYISKKEVDEYIKKQKNEISIVKTLQENFKNPLTSQHTVKFVMSDPFLSKRVYKNVNSYCIQIEDWEAYKKGLLTIEEASKYLNMPIEVMKMLWEKKHIRTVTMKDVGIRSHISYLDEYERIGLIPLEQLAMEMNTTLNVINTYFNTKEFIRIDTTKAFYIKRKKVDEFMNSYDAIKVKHNYKNNYRETNYYQFFEDSILYFQKKTYMTVTVDLYNKWARKRIKNSREKLSRTIGHYLNTLEELALLLTKELFEYTDDELKKLFQSIKPSYRHSIDLFVSYCKEKTDCAFNGNYILRKTKKTYANEMYTKEEWTQLLLHVSDVDKHFEKAVENKSYAHVWLYCLLHFSLAWRHKDMLAFKSISLDVVGIDGFDWFNNNIFTLGDAENVLKTVGRSMQGYLTSKKEQNAVFVVPFPVKMPTALAFVLCELHRREEDASRKKLIKNIKRNYLHDFIGEDLPRFKNKISNKTLMTYGFETAVKNDKGTLAYWLGGFSRSHTHNIAMPNSVTQVYLVTRNTDVDVEEMARHAFDRGIFGWQVKVMIDAINRNEPMKLEEMTKAIANINEEYSPLMIDDLSKFVVTRHEQSISLLKDLMKVPTEELKDRLKEISRLHSPSLIDHSQCLVGVKNCPFKIEVEYNLETPCLGCKNRIDTNYILDTVNVEIFSLIERLKKTNKSDHTLRIKYTHMIKSLAYILMDFKRMYDQFDTNYIRSFIDLDLLQANMRELSAKRFLTIDEVNV